MLLILRVVLIFLLVAVLAGGIAMLGNQLGRKIGRRKMTIFGMRPRHTSIFITTITGSLIACLTLGIAMVVSQDVRETILGRSERVEKLEEREQEMLTRIQKLNEEVTRGTIIWNYDERIALNTMPAGADERAVRNILGSLLTTANLISLDKNNKVAYRQDLQPYGLDTVLLKYGQEDFDKWVKEYTNLERPVGLWVVVTQNCLLKDEVPVTVQSFPVSVVFKKGDTIYSKELASSEVLLDWHVFLEELKAKALRKGMIEMNDSLGAVIEGDTLSDISKVLSRTNDNVVLKAIANRDLYQSSKLDVSIKVEQ